MAQTLSAPSPRGASDAERTAVVGKAVVRAAEALGLTGAELARTLGLSDASVSRLKVGTFALEPSSKAYELALLLIRLFRCLDAMTGGEEESRQRKRWRIAEKGRMNSLRFAGDMYEYEKYISANISIR